MEEKELIAKIQELRQIKPRKEWVVLTKNQILAQKPHARPSVVNSVLDVLNNNIIWKPALATATLLAILFSVFIISKDSLPGEILYPLKRITEKGQSIFVSEEEDLLQLELELAKRRLEELAKIAQENRVENLAPAIKEAETVIAKASKKLLEADVSENPSIIEKAKEIKEKKETIETSLGIVIGSEELAMTIAEKEKEILRKQVEDIIKNLENYLSLGVLTEKQKKVLTEMKKLAKEEKYSEVLILYQEEFEKEKSKKSEADI